MFGPEDEPTLSKSGETGSMAAPSRTWEQEGSG